MKEPILAVDDDLILLQMLEHVLGANYTVSSAKSGPQALRLLRKGYRPALILLDVDMPDMDGYETIEQIQGMEELKEVPVLFLSGLMENESELRGLKSGAWDYIRKPVEQEILKTRIEIHLKRGRLRQHAVEQKSERSNRKGEGLRDILTETEWNMARLMGEGYTNQEIGESLGYSYNYVKKVANRIFDKMEIKRRTELRTYFR